jgi:hypothetical protein
MGTDRVDFGNAAIRNAGFAEQYVLEITTPDFFVGIFGLSIGSIKPQNGAQSPTLLSAVAASKAIPSSSFSYTAGSVQSMLLRVIHKERLLTKNRRKYHRQLDSGWVRYVSVRLRHLAESGYAG